MQIVWYGQSCFKIVSKDKTIIVDPFLKDTGLTPPRGKADIVMLSNNLVKSSDFSFDNAFFVYDAGEYEIGGVQINGFSVFHKDKDENLFKKSIIYTFNIDGVNFCHLTDASEKQVLEVLDRLGEVNVLFLPIGGKHKIDGKEIDTLNSEEALSIVSEIDPQLVIPMMFKIPKLKIELDSEDKFLKSVGLAKESAKDRFSFKKKDLSPDKREFILMKTQI